MIAVDRKSRLVWIGLALLLVAAVVLPFLVKNYRVFQFNLVLVYAIAILGLNILTGFNGQFSLGHGAFYAIGAYSAAVLMDRLGMPYWATLPMAAASRILAASPRTLTSSPSGGIAASFAFAPTRISRSCLRGMSIRSRKWRMPFVLTRRLPACAPPPGRVRWRLDHLGVDRRPIQTHISTHAAPSLPALRCAARLQPWRCDLTT